MSSSNSEWREFEKLIARIERDLAPAGAQVMSPDRLPCKLTGKMREVDASVRFAQNGQENRVIIECRRHSKVQDVRWIEQLATKKHSLALERLIAVSSSGFSDEARVVAKHYGIELRVTREVDASELGGSFLDFVQFWSRRCTIESAFIFQYRKAKCSIPDDLESADYVLPGPLNPKDQVFLNIENQREFSLNDLWLELQEQVDPFIAVEKYSPPVTRIAAFPFPGNVHFKTDAIEMNVGCVVFRLSLWLDFETVSLEDARKVVYEGAAKPVERIEYSSSHGHPNRWLHLQNSEGEAEIIQHSVSSDWNTSTRGV